MENVTAFTFLFLNSVTSLIENFTDLPYTSTSETDFSRAMDFGSQAPSEESSSMAQGVVSVETSAFTPSQAAATSADPSLQEVPFWDSPLSHGINVFVGFALCFNVLGLGCTVEMSHIGEHIRRPIGVLLAVIVQFVIMPLVAFLMALIFALDEVAAVAVLLCGCCPRGNLSNIMSILVNGEMNLRFAGLEQKDRLHELHRKLYEP